MQKSLFLSLAAVLCYAASAMAKPHVVFVTLDDLSRGSLGAYGCPVPDISPNLDRLAAEGMRFDHFHVMATNCTPSRNHMMTGQYQQHDLVFSLGHEGAGNHRNTNTMPALFRAAGYHTGIMGKNSHQMPFEPHSAWDVEYAGYGSTRVPAAIYEKTKAAIADAKRLGKPLFFNLNLYDPHAGWYGWDGKLGPKKETENHPSRTYGPDDVPYPDFFPPLPESAQVGTTKGGTAGVTMKQELAAYYNTVKRADDSIGQMLRAFEEAGWLDNTVIVAISDHGMQQPGAKTSLYHEGTVSPLLVRWPGHVKPRSVNDTHMVGAIDILPTLCQLIGQPVPHGLDGRSFLPLIKGKPVGKWRDFVYMQQNDRNKSRAIQTRQWLYIVNPWADGETRFGSVSVGVHCWKLLKEASEKPGSPELLKSWVRRIEYRAPEELFDMAADPQCLHNLADDPAHAQALKKMRDLMLSEAKASGDDVMLDAIRNPRDPAVMARTVKNIEAMRERFSHDPNGTRRVHFDPLDGWMVIGNTMFEPFGQWGIWHSTSDTVGMNKDNGDDDAGPACVEFTGSGRMETKKSFDGSPFKQLKLEFRVPAKGRQPKGKRDSGSRGATVGRRAALIVEYNDGSEWHELVRRTGRKIPGDQSLVVDAPKGGFPSEMRIALRAELTDEDYFCVDGMRLSGWQDWRVHTDDSPAEDWIANNGKAISGPAIVLADTEVTNAELKNPLDRNQLGEVELSYRFTGTKVSDGDHLIVEYHNGDGWSSVTNHDYGYVLLAGTEYAGRVVLRDQEHQLAAPLRLRFRFEGTTDGREVRIDNLRLRSRRSFEIK